MLSRITDIEYLNLSFLLDFNECLKKNAFFIDKFKIQLMVSHITDVDLNFQYHLYHTNLYYI